MLDLYEELKSLTSALTERNIPFALCGGLAMAVHGHTRATIDIDILISPEALNDVIAVANERGYTIRGLDMSFADGAVEIRRVSKIDPSDEEVLSLDLLLVTPAIASVWEGRTQRAWEGGHLSVVSKDGLIKLKQLRGNKLDLYDIEQLSRASEN